MTTVASRDLRNHTADVLRQVAGGTPVTVTVNGAPVAQLTAVRPSRPHFLTRADLRDLIAHRQADVGLRADLEHVAGETTEDLDPV